MTTSLPGRKSRESRGPAIFRTLRSAGFLGLAIPAYAMLAYVVLPAVWRRHGTLPPEGPFPHLTYTAEGIPADPINVALVGTREDVVAAMRAAGWIQADRITFRSGLRDAGSVLFDRPYSAAPMSTHFVARRRPQDLQRQQSIVTGDKIHHRPAPHEQPPRARASASTR